jgi:hypothetical protein
MVAKHGDAFVLPLYRRNAMIPVFLPLKTFSVPEVISHIYFPGDAPRKNL